MSISTVTFKNFKAFKSFSVSLRQTNILVGPNNCGKSTVISAFRILEQALRAGRSRRAIYVTSYDGHRTHGHIISENLLPISLENVQYNYDNVDSLIEFRYSTGNKLFLFFPKSGGIAMYWDAQGRNITSPSTFKKSFPENIQVVPVLGPIEQEEYIVTDETVKRAAGTPRASRHFRNYWNKNPEGFSDFAHLVKKTWSGMLIKEPELAAIGESRLTMFVSENRIDRELYWSGLGFQIWCQLLTHISRCSDSDLLVVDEPEIYLHPEVQRQLLDILRNVRPDILLATHSIEIMSEADPNEILLVDKSKGSARRIHDIEGVQQAIDNLGSIQNITLTELARYGRVLFVEGTNDYKIIRKFAKLLGYDELASGAGLTVVESEGFGSLKKVESLPWGLEKTLGPKLKTAAVYDRDYRSDDEIEELEERIGKELDIVHFHKRKEIENYLLSPIVLQRAVNNALRERAKRTGIQVPSEICTNEDIEKCTAIFKSYCQSQYLSKYCEFHKKSGRDQASLSKEAIEYFELRWLNLDTRICLVPGKKVLKLLRSHYQNEFEISLTDIRIVSAYRVEDIPPDIVRLVEKLQQYVSSNSKTKKY